ncbi:hypothetical protein GJ496_008093 [Pomphorhynchus laevis]|nr:hypothetical protein GJ496_008093 [Pomphorhynchus laevis]
MLEWICTQTVYVIGMLISLLISSFSSLLKYLAGIDDDTSCNNEERQVVPPQNEGNLRIICKRCHRWIVQSTFTNFCEDCLNNRKKNAYCNNKTSILKPIRFRINSRKKAFHYYDGYHNTLNNKAKEVITPANKRVIRLARSAGTTAKYNTYSHHHDNRANIVFIKNIANGSNKQSRKRIKLKKHSSAPRLSRKTITIHTSIPQSQVRAFKKPLVPTSVMSAPTTSYLFSSKRDCRSKTTSALRKSLHLQKCCALLSSPRSSLSGSQTIPGDRSYFKQLKRNCKSLCDRIFLKFRLNQKYNHKIYTSLGSRYCRQQDVADQETDFKFKQQTLNVADNTSNSVFSSVVFKTNTTANNDTTCHTITNCKDKQSTGNCLLLTDRRSSSTTDNVSSCTKFKINTNRLKRIVLFNSRKSHGNNDSNATNNNNSSGGFNDHDDELQLIEPLQQQTYTSKQKCKLTRNKRRKVNPFYFELDSRHMNIVDKIDHSQIKNKSGANNPKTINDTTIPHELTQLI